MYPKVFLVTEVFWVEDELRGVVFRWGIAVPACAWLHRIAWPTGLEFQVKVNWNGNNRGFVLKR